MVSFKAVIIDKVGIHARPAAIIVGQASKFKSEIKINANGKTGDLKSIMTIIALGVNSGAEIEVTAVGEDEREALAAIKDAMIENKVI